MDLLGVQNELISRLATSSAKVVVALYTGSAINMPWLEEVDAVIQCGYNGLELGNALCDILSGDVVPSGRLPYSMPLRIQDNPSFDNFPGVDEIVEYKEGSMVGYRHYVGRGIPTQFAFGAGLSYTDFAISDLRQFGVLARGKSISLTCRVTNVGKWPARHTVLLFVLPADRSEITFQAFNKTDILEPGEAVDVDLSLSGEAFSRWTGAEDGQWNVIPGAYDLEVRHDAASSASAAVRVNVTEGWAWTGLTA
jgi:beta-glucosidase